MYILMFIRNCVQIENPRKIGDTNIICLIVSSGDASFVDCRRHVTCIVPFTWLCIVNNAHFCKFALPAKKYLYMYLYFRLPF